MKCPRDGTTLARIEIAGLGIELDKCHKCDGIWCDRGELERLRDSHLEGVEEVIERKYGDPEFEEGSVESYMRCPRCGADARLHRYCYTYVTRVQIDRCEKCYGVWLDDGELNAIIGEKKDMDEAASSGKLRKFLAAIGNLLPSE